MPDDEYEELIIAFNTYYRFLSIQSYAEANTIPATNTDADILYANFGLYADLAADELLNLLTARNLGIDSITENQEIVLLCHLVADHFEQGNSDWSFRSQSQAPGVSFSRGEKTGPRMALEKMLNEIQTATRMNSMTSGRGASMTFNKVKDAVNYPKRWKRTSIPAYDQTQDGFDSEPVSDLGYEDDHTNNSAW